MTRLQRWITLRRGLETLSPWKKARIRTVIRNIYEPYGYTIFCTDSIWHRIRHRIWHRIPFVYILTVYRSYMVSVFGCVYIWKVYRSYTAPCKDFVHTYTKNKHRWIWFVHRPLTFRNETVHGTVHGDVYCSYPYEQKPYTDRIRSV